MQANQPATPHIIRQGDVLLVPVKALPKNCKAMQPENGRRFVLAHGEVTGHAHAIYEFTNDMAAEQAAAAIQGAAASAEAQQSIDRAMSRRTAQMWICPRGEWYLEVRKPSTMKHEEHTAPRIPAGFYHAPIQVQETIANMPRRVAD